MSVGDRALRGSICGVIVRPSIGFILGFVELVVLVVLMVLVVLLSVALVIVVTITFLAVMV